MHSNLYVPEFISPLKIKKWAKVICFKIKMMFPKIFQLSFAQFHIVLS